MTACDDLAPAIRELRDSWGWECRTLPNGDAEITTGRRRRNAEPIRILVRVRDQTLTLSDGAETINRLADVGWDRNDPALAALWTEAIRAYRLQEIDDRVFVRTGIETAAHSINRLADALVALDGLSIVELPQPVKARTLADEVGDYLGAIYDSDNVDRSPRIKLRGGIIVNPALRLNAPNRRGVLVQPGAASSVTQSFDHSHTLFSLAHRGGVPQTNCLAVLGGSIRTWNPVRIRLLGDVAFVGFWEHREPLLGFLNGEIPEDPVMAPAGFDVPLLTV